MLRSPPKISIVVAVFLFCLILIGRNTPSLTGFYFLRQDFWLLLAMVALWLLPVRAAVSHFTLPQKGEPAWAVAGLLFLFCLAGHWLFLSGYDASRDEQMAVFDALIFASGHLVAPIGELWRDHSDALNTTFLYPAEQRGAWVSAYLPMNAAIRAGIGLLTGLPQLTGPLWTALGAVALWGCIRRLWPDNREAVWLGMLLYALSGQIVLTGMTAYAMPAHLTLNLVWLWLFLKRRLSHDLLALFVGFIAVGLHQPLMHPMFAAPILLLPVLERDWKRAGLFLAGYLLIGAFWFLWPDAMWHAVQSAPDANPPAGVGYLSRLIETVSRNGWSAIPLMLLNLARFMAWNHPLLLPLAAYGLFRQNGASKRYTLPVALAAGFLLTFVVMMAILPYQGHGFGYRYEHGLIGNVILLALYGWNFVKERSARWPAMMKWASLVVVLLIMPLQLWFAHGFYAAFAQPSRQIGAIDADYAVIRASGAPFAVDLVVNRPTLDNRPIRLIAEAIDPALTRELCTAGASVAVVPDSLLRPIRAYFGVTPTDETAVQEQSVQSFSEAGCRIVPVAATSGI